MTETTHLRRAMVIMAHPDDAEYVCGGTVALWSSQGVEVVFVIITDGSKGSNDPEMTPETLAALRQVEERAAARVLGVRDVVFLGYPDGELVATREVKRDLVREIRRFRPEAVIVMDPTVRFYGSNYINHSDHRAGGDAAVDAIFPAAGNRHFFPELLAEGFAPHSVREVYVMGSTELNMKIDISTVLDLKIAALKEHRSQVNPDDLDRWMREDQNAHIEEFRRLSIG